MRLTRCSVCQTAVGAAVKVDGIVYCWECWVRKHRVDKPLSLEGLRLLAGKGLRKT